MERASNSLEFRAFDVGHGDSLLVRFPGTQSFALIDCNRHEASNRGFGIAHDRSEPKALSYFRKLILDGASASIEFACVTHPHEDHYSGFAHLLTQLCSLGIEIKAYWDFGASAKKAKAMTRFAKTPEQRRSVRELRRLCDFKLELVDRVPRMVRYEPLVKPQKSIWSGYGVEIDLLAPGSKHCELYFNYLACRTNAERGFA